MSELDALFKACWDGDAPAEALADMILELLAEGGVVTCCCEKQVYVFGAVSNGVSGRCVGLQFAFRNRSDIYWQWDAFALHFPNWFRSLRVNPDE